MKHGVYLSLGVALLLAQLTGCEKRAPFNPTLAGHFFPLRTGFNWTYQVTYPNGAHETISDRVIKADSASSLHRGAVVVSEYSGGGIGAIRAELPQTHRPDIMTIETNYVAENGYIRRLASLGERTSVRLDEHDFLPQYLWPDRTWSNSLSPFEQLLGSDVLKITQNHRTFLEGREVAVPAGRFNLCIRIETEASYRSPAGISDKRYFIDWYAPDVGLVKTLVLTGGPDGAEIARIELLRFAKSGTIGALSPSIGRAIVPLSSKITNAHVSAHPLAHR